jgi:hypothetical protein
LASARLFLQIPGTPILPSTPRYAGLAQPACIPFGIVKCAAQELILICLEISFQDPKTRVELGGREYVFHLVFSPGRN